jgi:hypothetical protein
LATFTGEFALFVGTIRRCRQRAGAGAIALGI